MIKKYTETEFNNSHSKDELPLECIYCHKIFMKTKSMIQACSIVNNKNTGDFCSLKCCKLFQHPPLIVNCKQCNKTFRRHRNQIDKTKNVFCSCSCSVTYNNKNKTHGYRRSKLEICIESKLIEKYPDIEFHFNRKDTINSELDIYVPSLKLAFELNGIFHYEPIYGADQLSSIQNNDNRKFQACLESGIELCIIDVSSLKNFKEHKSIEYFNIIENIISNKIQFISKA